MAVKRTRRRSSGTRHAFASQENIYLGARPESASADSGRAKVPEGVRFAAAVPEVFMIGSLGARPESASADSGRAKVPEGVRFAAAVPEVFMIGSLGARPESASADSGRWLMVWGGPPRPPPPPPPP